MLFMYRNEFDSFWTIGLPGILVSLIMFVFVFARAGIIHGSLKKGFIYEMNAFFSDLAKDFNRWFRSRDRGTTPVAAGSEDNQMNADKGT